MDGIGLIFVYGLLAGAAWLGYVAVKRARSAATAEGPRLRRHAYGLSRKIELAGRTLHVRGEQEPTALSRWHVEVQGPFSRELTITRRRGAERADEGLDAEERVGGIGSWRVEGPAEVVATTLDAQTRAALAGLDSPFELRGGKLVATLEVRDPAGLTEIPQDALAFAQLLFAAPSGFARLVAAAGDEDPVVRALSMDALSAGYRATPEGRSALEAARSDRDPRVRVRAWLAAGDRERAVTEMKGAVAGKDGGRLQLALHALLQARLGEAALAPLWREATRAGWAGVALQRWVVAGVGNQVPAVVAALGGPEEAERRLCDMLEARSREVALSALAALERSGTAACVPRIQALRSHLGERFVVNALLRLQGRLGKGGELSLVDTAQVGALSEVEDTR